MACLSVRGVHTYYGQSHVLHGSVSQIESGRLVTLLGRNGMGKTTLMRTIMGLMPARTGKIEFNEQRIEKSQPYDIFGMGIGYVPQGRHVFPHLASTRTSRLGLRNKRQRSSPLFEKLFDLFPILKERLKQQAGTLSGGEQQQLALARALAGEVRLLLLDEPTEGIQPTIVDSILSLLVRINREDGLTILLVEQNMELALSVAQDYLIMEKGVIVEGGPAANIDKDAVISKYLCV